MDIKLKNKFNSNLERLLKEYNFQKVYDVMTFLDWTWYLNRISNFVVPNIDDMKDCVRKLFNLAINEDNFNSTCATNGFFLKLWSNGDIRIWFSVCDYDTNLE